jgi:DinB family protein
MNEEYQRVRSYLVAQGAKLSPAAIVEKVEQAMAELNEAAAAVPPARFSDRPSPDEWSGNEVMAHVVAAGAYFAGGMRAAIDGTPTPSRPEGRGIENAPRRDAGTWREILARDRAALFERVLGADPGARLERSIEHPMFGALNWRETLLFFRLHDLDHAGQLRKIAAALA